MFVRNDREKPKRNDSAFSLYGKDWIKLRKKYIMKQPLCQLCLKDGKRILATEVIHIVPVADGGEHNDSNLMSLCSNCISQFLNT